MGTRILVGSIRWLAPHTPALEWVVWKEVGPMTGAEAIAAYADAILEDGRYFGRCGTCGELKPRGWMLGSGLCQACAERDHGVVF